MKKITVFTPTFNRANTLGRTYQSLINQTSKDFEWLIVDDGSCDNTKDLVNQWMDENKLNIRYIFKENGGLHTGYNVAIQNITTELCICCDSDDFLPENAIELICDKWEKEGNDKLAGIIGLDFIAFENKPIGGYFQGEYKTVHFTEVESKLGHRGDFKMVLRTELIKPFVPMPSFENEKNFNPIYIFFKVNPDLEYLVLNDNLCNVDYQVSGMSANILNQFRNSPRSFAELRKIKLTHPRISIFRKFIDAAHLVSCSLIAKDLRIIADSPQKLLIAFSFPLGIAFYAYVMYKTSDR